MDCSGRAVKAAAGYRVSGPGSIPAAPTSRDSLMIALGAGNKYPEAQGLGLGKPLFLDGVSLRMDGVNLRMFEQSVSLRMTCSV